MDGLKRAEESLLIAEESLSDIEHSLNKLITRAIRLGKPGSVESASLQSDRENAHGKLRACAREVEQRITQLTLASLHFPELLVCESALLQSLRSDSLEFSMRSLRDYTDLTPLETDGGARHHVYKAVLDGSVVVLKEFTLTADLPRERRAFMKEARLLHRLRHPNVAAIHAYFFHHSQGECKAYVDPFVAVVFCIPFFSVVFACFLPRRIQ